MRDPARIDRMIEKLRTYWKQYPDLRLGQIVGNCQRAHADVYYVEDDEVERGLDEALQRSK